MRCDICGGRYPKRLVADIGIKGLNYNVCIKCRSISFIIKKIKWWAVLASEVNR